MNSFPFIDIFILAMIAVFIVNRLRNTLGKKTGNETDIAQKFNQKQTKVTESRPDKEIRELKASSSRKEKVSLHKDETINEKLNKLVNQNPNFDLDKFIDGSKKAFEYILISFSNNDVKSLKPLLSTEIFKSFSEQIKTREKSKENLAITILSIDDPEIIDVKLDKANKCSFKLEFKSQQVQTTKDKNDQIIDGNDNLILNITELWTFSKPLKSSDPNWILEKIEEKE